MKLPRTVTKRAATVVLLAAITALILWPRELLTSLALTLFAVVVFKARRYMHNRRQRRQINTIPEGTQGVYILDVGRVQPPHVTEFEHSHGKFGHGAVKSRIAQHHTVGAPIRIRGVVYTATKDEAYWLEQTLKRDLRKAGMLMKKTQYQRGEEKFYATEAALAIVDEFLRRHRADRSAA